MNIEIIKIDDPVVYIPSNLPRKIKDENLGVVTSKNKEYVFVRYIGKSHSQATNAKELFSLVNRPDLKEKLERSPKL